MHLHPLGAETTGLLCRWRQKLQATSRGRSEYNRPALASTRGRGNGLVCAKRLCPTSSVNASRGIDTFSIPRRRLSVRFLTGLVGNGLVCANGLVSSGQALGRKRPDCPWCTNTSHPHPHNRVILREQTPLWGVCESNFKKQATNCLLF